MGNKMCFKCQGLGHVAADCPNKRVITLVEYEAIKEEKIEEEQEEDVKMNKRKIKKS